MLPYLLDKAPYWITRFGEIGIALPLGLVLALWQGLAARCWRAALVWLRPLGLAVLLTALSKFAFIGWGWGIAAIDFTGFSGHAMVAAAIYPALAYHLAAGAAPPGQRWALLTGYGLALLVAWSRVHIQVHSWSEVLTGFALGATASGWSIRQTTALAPPRRWVIFGLAAWLLVMPLHAAPSRSHDIVTRIALVLADHTTPFRRADLQRPGL